MKTRILLFLLGAMACYGAEDTETSKSFSASVETTFASSYLWRGYVVNDSPSFQPAVNLEMRGFSVSVWNNFSRKVPHNQAWTENDLSIEYTKTLGRFALSAGVLDYYFPDLPASEGNRTEELSFGVAYDTLLSPSFKVYHDIRSGHGNYFFAGAEHSVTVHQARSLSLDFAGGVGLNHHLYQPVTTISDIDFTAALNVPKGNLIFSPFISCMAGQRTLFGTHAAFGLKVAFSR